MILSYAGVVLVFAHDLTFGGSAGGAVRVFVRVRFGAQLFCVPMDLFRGAGSAHRADLLWWPTLMEEMCVSHRAVLRGASGLGAGPADGRVRLFGLIHATLNIVQASLLR